MNSEEKVLTIKDGEIKDASIEDALMLLDVAPKICGFDNEGFFWLLTMLRLKWSEKIFKITKSYG